MKKSPLKIKIGAKVWVVDQGDAIDPEFEKAFKTAAKTQPTSMAEFLQKLAESQQPKKPKPGRMISSRGNGKKPSR